jgi:hypothetical protein
MQRSALATSREWFKRGPEAHNSKETIVSSVFTTTPLFLIVLAMPWPSYKMHGYDVIMEKLTKVLMKPMWFLTLEISLLQWIEVTNERMKLDAILIIIETMVYYSFKQEGAESVSPNIFNE